MTDLIERDALLKDLRSECPECGVCISDVPCIECIIGSQPTIDAHPVWIPVSERLPEKDAQVLVYVAGYIGTAYFDAANGVFGLTALSTLSYRVNGVTHWMPVPEPPKSEG